MEPPKQVLYTGVHVLGWNRQVSYQQRHIHVYRKLLHVSHTSLRGGATRWRRRQNCAV